MPFTNTTLQDSPDLPAGEVITASPYNVSAFELFENGLVEGRFCKFDNGSIDNLDASGTPVIAGIVKRKITGEIGTGIYSTSGMEIDQVAEVINFGFATVTVTGAARPSKYDQVYTVNDVTADAGKATDSSGETIVNGAVFWEEKKTGVWLVRVMMGVETTTSYVAAPSSLEISAADGGDGSAAVTIQAKSADGTNYAENVCTRVWVGTSDNFTAVAIDGLTVDTGTVKESVTSKAENILISGATGLIVLTLNNTDAGSLYLWAEISGNIYASGAIVITSE
jgi:hypothetical protein